ARLAVGPVVGAHYSFRLAFDDSGAEGGQVGLLQIALADRRVEAVPLRLGAAVNREVLRRRDDLQVAGVVALQALDIGDADARSQIWVFAESLHAAPPARVAEDIDVRAPEGQPLVAASVVLPRELVVLRTRLGRDHVGDAANEFLVPRRGQSDGLRE